MSSRVDLTRVQRARRELDKIAKDHPELTQGKGIPWKARLDELDDLTMARDSATRQREWRARQGAAGRREFRVWLDATDAERLEGMLEARSPAPGTRQDALREIIAEALAALSATEGM